MDSADVSVIVTDCEDAEKIRRCLESVRGFGETVLVESFSAGGVLEVAREYPVVVYRRPERSAADQKNWAMSRVSRKWVLALDGNEELDETLIAEVANADETSAGGFEVRRTSEYLGKVLRGGATAHDKPVRLFDRSRGRFVQKGSTVEVKVEGRVGTIGGTIRRVWYRDVRDHFEAVNRETTCEAREYVERGGRLPVVHMLARPPLRFLRMYFGEMGFKDGARGLVFCWISSFAAFIKYAKAWEYRRNERRRTREGGGRKG
jgi:glycosyltransferase involved in cell wall biosynthesis